MRKGCWDCCIKHLSKAIVTSSEVHLGYPEHAALVIGNLSEAEDEIVDLDKELANNIRAVRLKYTNDFSYKLAPELFDLFNRALTGKFSAEINNKSV